MTGRCRITTFQLFGENVGPGHPFRIEGERLAEVLAQSPALARLHLSGNEIGADGAGRLARVLSQCPALAHLDLSWNKIGDDGAGRLAGVLAQVHSAGSPQSQLE